MPNENRNELTAIESALSGLVPAPPQGNRDRLLYAAGRSAGSRPWKRAACGLVGTCVALTVFLLIRPPLIVDRPVFISVPVPGEPSPSPPVAPPSAADALAQVKPIDDERTDSSALDFRRNVLRWGPDLLPSTLGSPTAVPAPQPRPLEKDLDLPPGSLNGVEPRRPDLLLAPW
jgi:hypothetical protein